MNEHKSKRPGKKTETIEIRLPLETKAALSKRAAIEGRSMSDVVRNQIDQYLAGKNDFSMHSSRLKRHFALSHKKAISAMAAFFTILALSFGLIAPSQADDVELSVGGWVTKGNGNATITSPGKNKAIELTADSVSTTSLKDTVTTNYGDTISIRNQAGNGLTYILELTPQQNDQGAIFVAITLKSIDGRIEKTLATPSLLIVDQKNAQITIPDNDNASVYSIKVTAKKL